MIKVIFSLSKPENTKLENYKFKVQLIHCLSNKLIIVLNGFWHVTIIYMYMVSGVVFMYAFVLNEFFNMVISSLKTQQLPLEKLLYLYGNNKYFSQCLT